jgi:mono/diheme cytochrome c family protein
MKSKAPLPLRVAVLALAAGAITLGASALAQSASQSATPVGFPGDADGAFIIGAKFNEPTGEKMYKRVCAGCHMPDAKGAQGAGFYPALAGNAKLGANAYPVMVVLKGMNGMPAIGTMMSDQQVADVVNYVRTNFGNRYSDAVTPADVQAMR